MEFIRIDEQESDFNIHFDLQTMKNHLYEDNFMYKFILTIRAIYTKALNSGFTGLTIHAGTIDNSMLTPEIIKSTVQIAIALKKEFGHTNIIRKAKILHNTKLIDTLTIAVSPFIYEKTLERIEFKKITD